MNQPYLFFVAIGLILLVTFMFLAIWVSHFVKVAPNQVLVVSGRKVQRPDGSFVGYRFVKSGGTMVFPVIERADTLWPEVIKVEMAGFKAQTANQQPVRVDYAAQLKINSDDASLALAAEHFLSKSQSQLAEAVRPVLEKHLASVLAALSYKALDENPGACAAQVQAAAGPELNRIEIAVVGFTIRNGRTA